MSEQYQRCGNCRWWREQGAYPYCCWPAPFWIMRELHDPSAGHGAMASTITPASGEGCATWEEPTK